MSDYYEHLEAAWNDLSKEDKEKFISGNIRRQQPFPYNSQNPKPMTQEERNARWDKLINPQQPIPQDIAKWIEDEARKEEIYERKYGGKDHSGYDTKMLYEVNYERSECFEKGAKAMYQLLLPELQQLRESVESFNRTVGKQDDCIIKQAAEIESLKEWKRQAIEVMPDMQTIGKELGVGLGETIHDKILPGIKKMKEEINFLRKVAAGARPSITPK